MTVEEAEEAEVGVAGRRRLLDGAGRDATGCFSADRVESRRS